MTTPEQRLWFCTGCGNCCRWPGDVKLTTTDLTTISAHLGLDEATFIERYTRLRLDRQGLSLVDQGSNTACVFLSADERCTIQSVKPKQCRDFPNGWHQANFEKDCAAIALRYRLRRVASAADGDANADDDAQDVTSPYPAAY